MTDCISAHLDPNVIAACLLTTIGWSLIFAARNHYLVKRIEVLEERLHRLTRHERP